MNQKTENGSLEERVEEWMRMISERVREMDKNCGDSLAAMPPLPEYNHDMSDEEEEKYWEEDSRRMHFFWRKGLSEDEWKEFRTRLSKQKQELWKEFIIFEGSDYDSDYLLKVLKFKLRWMIFYWDNFGHGAEGWHESSQMKLAYRLIGIILSNGLDSSSSETIPYVNVRNEGRFHDFNLHQEPYFALGTVQEVRFRKAYCLLWALLKGNLLNWWD